MTTLTQARLDVAFHNLAVRICINAEKAKSRLCGTSGATSGALPSFTGYTYVTGARVKYSVARPMYDEYADDEMLVYYVTRFVTLKFPPMGLIQAREHIGATWEAATAKVKSVYFQEEEYLDDCRDEFSSITEIKLLDAFGNVVDAICDRNPWIQDSQVVGDVKAMKARIVALKDQSAFESGWDNHETSRSLDAAASSIADQISMIEYRSRLVA